MTSAGLLGAIVRGTANGSQVSVEAGVAFEVSGQRGVAWRSTTGAGHCGFESRRARHIGPSQVSLGRANRPSIHDCSMPACTPVSGSATTEVPPKVGPNSDNCFSASWPEPQPAEAP